MSAATPSASLIAQFEAELARHAPFAQMAPAHRRRFVEVAEQVYFAPGETVLEPAMGPVTHLLCVRSGGVKGEQRLGAPGPFAVEPGECFPFSAVLGERPVTAVYQAVGDTFCLRVPAAAVRELLALSAPFADFANRRVLQLLALSQQALRDRVASRALTEQTLETPLSHFVKRPPLAVAPATPLGEALQAMQRRRVGSVLVTDEAGAALGILTRHDVLERVLLAARPLAAPVADVMSRPVHTLDRERRAHDAALLMSRERVRHVPITHEGRVVGIVSERDLFALQRLSLTGLGSAIDGADDPALLREAAAGIRRFAEQLLAQGVAARALTELVSHLNDRLTARLAQLTAQRHGLDLAAGCWLAFGSEGRGEQTVATDQDNGLVHPGGPGDAERWRAFGEAVNEALADCGVPLCQGGVMAGRPECCLAAGEWRERFAHWIDHGTPQDLLNAAIFFDLRPLAGQAALAAPLTDLIAERASATPRFLKLLAEQALTHRPPLAWHGGLSEGEIDLKLQGTALFVEAARVLALAAGVKATGTRARLEAAAAPLKLPPAEVETWCAAFDHLQLLRLGAQVGAVDGAHPNRCNVAALNDIDRRVLRETLRAARRLQQRLALDWAR